MKRIILSIFILTMSVSGLMAQSKTEKKVAQAVEDLRLALISGNKADLEAIIFDDLSYGHSSGKLEDKALFLENLTNGNSDFVSIDFLDQTIAVEGKTAIVRHVLDAKTNDKGNPGTVKLKILLVFAKDHGHWKLLARQAVKFQ